MLNKKDFEVVLIKYLTKQASTEELNNLSEYLKDTSYREIFDAFVKADYLSNYNLQNFDTEKEVLKILKTIEKKKKKKRILLNSFRYVAAVVLLFAVGYFYFLTQGNKAILIRKESAVNIKPGIDKATLTLEDGTNITLNEDKNYNNEDLNVVGKEIVYKKKKRKKVSPPTIKYHHITVPKGGKFFVTLSDDTKVYVNADSKLKYPVEFQGKERAVELLYGEAFFEVSDATKHDGKKFVVYTQKQKIEVLGTAFNVRFYKNEKQILTTLAEGRVRAINTSNEQQTNIKPGEQLRFNLGANTFNVHTVDLTNEISWKDGFFKFNNKSLFEIMQTLSRWYNVSVSFEDKTLKEIIFSGSFNRNQNLEDIIDSISQTKEVSFYFKNNNIIVTQYKDN